MVYVVQIVSMLMIHNMNTPLLKLGRLVESLVMFHIFEIVKEILFCYWFVSFSKVETQYAVHTWRTLCDISLRNSR